MLRRVGMKSSVTGRHGFDPRRGLRFCVTLATTEYPVFVSVFIVSTYVPIQRIVFFARGIFLDFSREISLISQKNDLFGAICCYSPVGIFLDFSREFSQWKELFGAGYPLVWFILKQLFTSLSVKSDRYLIPLRWIIVQYLLNLYTFHMFVMFLVQFRRMEAYFLYRVLFFSQMSFLYINICFLTQRFWPFMTCGPFV